MPQTEATSFWAALTSAGGLSGRWLRAREGTVELAKLAQGSSLGSGFDALRNKVVLLAVSDQLPAALALIELDGFARRLVLCPPGVPKEHLRSILRSAEIDVVVGDPCEADPALRGAGCYVGCSPGVFSPIARGAAAVETEWVLLTSGTTGPPKLAVHTLGTLAAPIANRSKHPTGAVWSTFYDIRRYGGLQILLRAMLGGGSIVLSSHRESVADFLERAGADGVTHVTGTPSHWRRVLMSPAARLIAPGYVRLSGEIVDQAVLEQLRATYPSAHVGHAFASTEAGVAFEVDDGLAGFPVGALESRGGDVEIKIEDGSLRIRSGRTALGYLDHAVAPMADADGFVDTGDLVERCGGRFYFIGRRGGIINVGGNKVHPESVEEVINRHPQVAASLVKPRRNPISGAIVVADVVAKISAGELGEAASIEKLRGEILARCRARLLPHQVPAVIRFVPALEISASGKLLRSHA
jgi:acyl-coenzyme A synthetase/AMP-(fatty) acid ligase